MKGSLMISARNEQGGVVNVLGSEFELWQRQVEANRALNDQERCMELLTLGATKWGARPNFQIFAAETHAALGYFMEALQCYDSAILLADGADSSSGNECVANFDLHIEALLCSAALLSELGYYEEAHLRYRAVCDLDTDGGERYFGKVIAASAPSVSEKRLLSFDLLKWAEKVSASGDLELACDAAMRALDLVDSAEARLCLASLFLKRGEPAKALENLEWGRRLEPSRPEFQTLAARCFLMLNKLKEAQDALLRAELLGNLSLAGKTLRIASKTW